MKKLKQKVSDPIPSDLLIDIFSRVPAECIARFRCVSKLWGSIPRLPYFTELFLTKSLTRPRILFCFRVHKELFVFSSPQPDQHNLGGGEDYSLVATRYNYFSKYTPSKIYPPLNGLLLFHGRRRRKRVPVICNPVTGESITLPNVKATSYQKSFFGYDPINKQFKVLCMTYRSRYRRPNTHRILTLGTGKRVWRSTMQCKPHYPLESTSGICIDGVLYYKALLGGEGDSMIVCFDFRFEKFSFINIDEELSDEIELINYKGKLGAHQFTDCMNQDELVLWVLEDAGEHKWSKSMYVLPLFRGTTIRESCEILEMTGTGEIVFTPYTHSSNHFYVVFYNMERNTFTRVNILGLEEFKHHSIKISTFLHYVESMTTLM